MRLTVKVGWILFLISAVGCNRTEKDTSIASGGKITFQEQTYDFGQLTEGEIVQHEFEFTNTGDVPIEIIDVQVQCGCTVASKPEGLIGVGRSDRIAVQFNSSGKLGINKKLVNVIANTAEPIKPIEFTATVVAATVETATVETAPNFR